MHCVRLLIRVILFLRTNGAANDGFHNCLGSFGGPVFPYVALGGFLPPGETILDEPTPDEYLNSTVIIITILIQNYVDAYKLEPAFAWEKK